MRLSRHVRTGLMGVAFLMGGSAAASAAEFVIIEARGVTMRPGQTIDSTKPLVLTAGQHITLITPTGATIKLDGPYNKAPDADQGRGVPVANVIALLVTQRQARVGEVGTTRGLAPNELPDPWVLDVSRNGTVCHISGTPAVFWRPTQTADAELSVTPTDRSWKADAHWPAGADRILVATKAPIRSGTTYLVTLGGTRSALTVADVPADLANDAMRAAWLAGKGCEAQAEALLRNGQ